MEVYLLEYYYDSDETTAEIVLHVPNTDLWFVNEGFSEERIVNADFTQLFWEDVGKGTKLTKLGDL